MTTNSSGVPPALLHTLMNNLVLHERVVLLPAALAALAALSDLGFKSARRRLFPQPPDARPSPEPGMPLWQAHMFAAMVRNWETSMSFFNLPVSRVVELGSRSEI